MIAHVATPVSLYQSVRTDTPRHAIEIHEGCLTIGETTFPDHCVSLSAEETSLVLEILLISPQGLHPCSDDDDPSPILSQGSGTAPGRSPHR